jgi:hypothetical protein
MSRRPDPVRRSIARRAAIRNRLIGDGLLPAQADRWLSAWAEKVGQPESAAEFDAAYEWIISELAGARGAMTANLSPVMGDNGGAGHV